MNPLPPPASQGQAVARRRRAMRRIQHWHHSALRGLLQIDGDPVAQLLLTQAAIRLQLLASDKAAAPVQGPPTVHTP